MNDLITKLGIDWKLLLAQIINFLILLWVLKRFAYKPILGALDKRSKKIADSLEQAKQIETELAAMAQEKQRVVSQAHHQAQKIIEEARQNASAYLEQTQTQAKAEAAAVVQSAAREARAMKDAVVAEAKDELADLIVVATERVVRVKLDAASDQKLIAQSLRSRS